MAKIEGGAKYTHSRDQIFYIAKARASQRTDADSWNLAKFKVNDQVRNQIKAAYDEFSLKGIHEFDRNHLADQLRQEIVATNKSKAGLVGSLVRQGHLTAENVNTDGTIKTDALAQNSYFEDKTQVIDLLAQYKLSEKSRVLRDARDKTFATEIRSEPEPTPRTLVPQQPKEEKKPSKIVRFLKSEPVQRITKVAAAAAIFGVLTFGGGSKNENKTAEMAPAYPGTTLTLSVANLEGTVVVKPIHVEAKNEDTNELLEKKVARDGIQTNEQTKAEQAEANATPTATPQTTEAKTQTVRNSVPFDENTQPIKMAQATNQVQSTTVNTQVASTLHSQNLQPTVSSIPNTPPQQAIPMPAANPAPQIINLNQAPVVQQQINRQPVPAAVTQQNRIDTAPAVPQPPKLETQAQVPVVNIVQFENRQNCVAIRADNLTAGYRSQLERAWYLGHCGIANGEVVPNQERVATYVSMPGNVVQDKIAAATTAIFGAGAVRMVIIMATKESGLDQHVINKDSGACGIPQANPCSKLLIECGNLENLDCQINWMMKYIKSRYGTVEVAYQHQLTYGWY